jgi:hypothetical protein
MSVEKKIGQKLVKSIIVLIVALTVWTLLIIEFTPPGKRFAPFWTNIPVWAAGLLLSGFWFTGWSDNQTKLKSKKHRPRGEKKHSHYKLKERRTKRRR